MAMTIETLLSILTSGLVLGGIYATVATAPAVVNRAFSTPPLRSFLKVLARCEPRKRRHMPYTPQNRTGSTLGGGMRCRVVLRSPHKIEPAPPDFE